MAFQFQCPQGHLLEAEEVDAGKTCQCPYCGLTLAIPISAATSPATPPAVMPTSSSATPALPSVPAGVASELPPVVGHRRHSPQDASLQDVNSMEEKSFKVTAADVTEEEELFHILCPNGHELEVPQEMLDQTALCPHCNSRFRLRERDSVEYKKKKVVAVPTSENKKKAKGDFLYNDLKRK